MMTKTLNWAYDKALNGLPGTPTSQDLGDSYLKRYNDRDIAIDMLIKWQVAKCATSGFVTGLGGLITLPVAVPADLAVTFYVNIRMVAAIAHIHGHDIHDDQTRTAVFLCLVGDAVGEVLSKAGVKFTEKFARAQLMRMSAGILKKINQAVAFKLATKFGQKGIINLFKLVPILSGVVGGTVNGLTCKGLGKVAKRCLAA